MLTSSCVTGHVDLHVGKDLVEISHPAKKEIMLTKSMMLMLIVEINHHVGIPKKKVLLKYWMKRNKGDVHQRLLMTSVMAQTRPCVCVCLCVHCLLTQLCTRAHSALAARVL